MSLTRRFSPGCLLILLGCVAAVPAAAAQQQYRFDSWTTDNGLPQNTVRDIVQTRDGYLWLTTFDGLVRFDGVRFTVFDKSNTPAITNNRFTALYEDTDGTLWAGAEQGEVVSYRGGVFTSHTPAEGFSSATIVAFMRPSNDELMIITAQGSFYRRAGKFVPAPPEYSDDRMKLYRGRSGAQWTINTTGAVAVRDGRTFRYPIKLDFAVAKDDVWPYEDSQGNLWLGDRAGLYRLRDGQALRYTERDGLPPRVRLRPQCEDDDGGVWFATGALVKEGLGVVRFKDGRFTVYGSDAGLPVTSYNQIIKDREGSIWVATSSGLYHLRRGLITTFSTADGLANNEVYPLLQARNGSVWVGTNDGLSLWRKGKFQSHPLNGFKVIVQSLWEDNAGRLWVGLLRSLHCFENGRLKDLTPLMHGEAMPSAIREDQAGAVWVATNRGLFKFVADKVVAHYTTKDGLPSDDVKVIHESIGEDGQRVLWVGTYGGLARFKDDTFTAYTTADGLTGNRVRSIYEDSDGALWVGTYDDGLSRFRDGQFFNYRTEQGLFNNGVFQILEDRRGYFWISCNKGIYRVSRRELNDLAEGRSARINSVAFGKQDGMLNTECNGGRQPAGLVADDGRLWFPTMGGVAVIDPEAAQLNPQPPPVMIEAVTLERGQVDFRDGVSVAPGQDDLEINYTGLSLTKPEQVKFKYRLEGLDADWVDAGTRRVVYFPYLPPGSYRFRVIAANSDGVWNTEGAWLDVFVATPFYRAWWFITLIALSLAGIALLISLLISRQRFAAWRARQAAQEAFARQLLASQEAERQRIAAELHDSLGQNLLIVKNWALVGLNTLATGNPAREHLTEISATTSLALDEVREIAHNLRPYQLERLGLTNTLEYMKRHVANSSDIEFTVELENVDGLLSPESEINFYRIVQELINNVIKHSAATETWLSIKRTAGGAQIICRDDGRGFDPVAAARAEQSGMGLSGMAERVRILGGRYTIESAPGAGAIVSITINATQP